ncbi:c-type cytochrome [Methylophaga thiooxydans]|uniref:Cytochrome c subfamily n=1 Tax=Methylophaga thiooxydans DMS010 TaxID=637616 RepID=C0N738_9GAMM|nr:c-type cytochrome [Methylophaga thiooxydans]EEF79391.1 Cytochrome c subfamily [Methylophaga thiooxydans DMS010]
MSLYQLLGACCLLLSLSSLHAQERNAALLASACAACHGTNGHSVAGTPSLAGLDKMYFVEQMQLFQTGQRPSTVMMKHAKGYSEDEIRLLAEFFSQQK